MKNTKLLILLLTVILSCSQVHCRTQKDEKDIELGLDFQRREKIGNFVVAIHT